MANKKILIVEDDETLASALAEFITRNGFEAVVCDKSDVALREIEEKQFVMAFVDCLLPGMPGVDLVKEMRSQPSGKTLPVVMMSAIFTDTQSIRETQQATQAVDFLKKPFELEALGAIIAQHVSGPMGQPLVSSKAAKAQPMSAYKKLYSLLGKTNISDREKRRVIEGLDEVHGFDLPYILSLLVETKSSGHLNIVNESGELSGISLNKGNIIHVDVPDQKSYLGQLLLDKGYVVAQDLDWALNNQSNKKVGRVLIEKNMISPHAFDIALKEQMNIRLSKSIFNATVSINFVQAETESTGADIDADEFLAYLHDWVASKISHQWLVNHYASWGDYKAQLGPQYKLDHPALKTRLVGFVPGMLKDISDSPVFSDYLLKQSAEEENLLKVVHFLICKGILIFGDRLENESEDQRILRVQKLHEQMKSKNSIEVFEMMGGGRDTSEEDIVRIYEEFKAFMGKEPQNSQSAFAKIYFEIMRKAEEAYKLFLNKDELKEFERQLATAKAQSKMKLQNDFEQARQYLMQNQAQKAFVLLQQMRSLDAQFDNLKIYLVWSRLGLSESQENKAQILKEIERDLASVPAEEKYTALYAFVMGLFHKHAGQPKEAKKQFEKALAMDSQMLQARRELHLIKANEKTTAAPKDIFNRDLKDVVSEFFKRK